MRKIEKDMLAALRAGMKMPKGGNTQITYRMTAATMVTLHGHEIARFTSEMTAGGRYTIKLEAITLAGWPTATTKSRLRVLLLAFRPGYDLYTRDGTTRLHRGRDADSEAMPESGWVTL